MFCKKLFLNVADFHLWRKKPCKITEVFILVQLFFNLFDKKYTPAVLKNITWRLPSKGFFIFDFSGTLKMNETFLSWAILTIAASLWWCEDTSGKFRQMKLVVSVCYWAYLATPDWRLTVILHLATIFKPHSYEIDQLFLKILMM